MGPHSKGVSFGSHDLKRKIALSEQRDKRGKMPANDGNSPNAETPPKAVRDLRGR